ncbi:MAG: DEAD/DEAH box helicase [Bacteriovoracaceae bacterium]|nr:DEAD/DEAH box helicase [Bacteriovoracaceae bacterium]
MNSNFPLMTTFIDPNIRDVYQQLLHFFESDQANLKVKRTLASATTALSVLDFHLQTLSKNTISYPYLKEVWEEDFFPVDQWENKHFLLHTALTSENLLQGRDLPDLPLEVDLTDSVVEDLKKYTVSWWQERVAAHQASQEKLKNLQTLKLNFSQYDCQCVECLNSFRNQLRMVYTQKQQEIINQHEEKMFDAIVTKSLGDISQLYQQMKRFLDGNLSQARHHLRRSSATKCEIETRAELQKVFGHTGSLGKVYVEKLKAYLLGIMVDEQIRPEILSEQDWTKFYQQAGLGIWQQPNFIKREFLKYLRTVLSFKRKDISSTILSSYLGQFWIHSTARRMNRKIIYHMGPTNSGKTYHAIEALCTAKRGCYLAPLRLLASELYDTMNSKGVPTTLLTGEEVIEKSGATHYSATVEMAKVHEFYDCCVIDEIQMIADPQRGWAWTRALINLCAPEVHICGDASVLDLIKQILKLTGDSLEIKYYERMTELKVESTMAQVKDLKKGDALIVFSRRSALKFKAELERQNFKVSIIYGMLNPEVRREQARKFDEGETDIMVSTDAIAMGMNLPVRRIVFSAFSKFIDSREHPLTMSETKQISGRAGRYGRFPVGFVTCLQHEKNMDGLRILSNSLYGELEERTHAMVGPDLEIFSKVNRALEENNLRRLDLSEFLRLFNTMNFENPFFCVQLTEMIEITEMVERLNENTNSLTEGEIFGFACAPVNLGLVEHVEYFIAIVSKFVHATPITCQEIDSTSDDIDYLESAIKCMELYQWLARHFANKNFHFDLPTLIDNKSKAVEKLNHLLSEKGPKYAIGPRDWYDRGRQQGGFGGGGGGGNQRRGNGGGAGGSSGPSRPPFNKRKKPSSSKYGRR